MPRLRPYNLACTPRYAVKKGKCLRRRRSSRTGGPCPHWCRRKVSGVPGTRYISSSDHPSYNMPRLRQSPVAPTVPRSDLEYTRYNTLLKVWEIACSTVQCQERQHVYSINNRTTARQCHHTGAALHCCTVERTRYNTLLKVWEIACSTVQCQEQHVYSINNRTTARQCHHTGAALHCCTVSTVFQRRQIQESIVVTWRTAGTIVRDVVKTCTLDAAGGTKITRTTPKVERGDNEISLRMNATLLSVNPQQLTLSSKQWE